MSNWWAEKSCFAMVGVNIAVALTGCFLSGHRVGAMDRPWWPETLVCAACLLNLVAAGFLIGVVCRIKGRSER